MVPQDDVHLAGIDVHNGFAAAGVDHHVDLTLIHGDGHLADGLRIVAELLELALHIAGSLARAREIIARHLIAQRQHAHACSHSPRRPPSNSRPQAVNMR